MKNYKFSYISAVSAVMIMIIIILGYAFSQFFPIDPTSVLGLIIMALFAFFIWKDLSNKVTENIKILFWFLVILIIFLEIILSRLSDFFFLGNCAFKDSMEQFICIANGKGTILLEFMVIFLFCLLFVFVLRWLRKRKNTRSFPEKIKKETQH